MPYSKRTFGFWIRLTWTHKDDYEPGTLDSNIGTCGNPVFPPDICTVPTASMLIWSFKRDEEAQYVVCTWRKRWGADNAAEGNLGMVEMCAEGGDGATSAPLGKIGLSGTVPVSAAEIFQIFCTCELIEGSQRNLKSSQMVIVDVDETQLLFHNKHELFQFYKKNSDLNQVHFLISAFDS